MQQGVFDLYMVAKEDLANANSKVIELQRMIEAEKKIRVRIRTCEDLCISVSVFFFKKVIKS
jgi:hypothetical protein